MTVVSAGKSYGIEGHAEGEASRLGILNNLKLPKEFYTSVFNQKAESLKTKFEKPLP